MKEKTLLSAVFFLLAPVFLAQENFVPKNNAQLHYNRVYFEEASVKNAHTYELRIQTDSAALQNDSALFIVSNFLPGFSFEKLKWGKKYYWQVLALNKRKQVLQKSTIHNFALVDEIGSPYFDAIKIDILTNKPQLNAGGFMAIDYLRGVYSRSGNLIWKLPAIPNLIDASSEIRDLKFTKDNSITLLSSSRPLEIDLYGNVLWQLPNPFVLNNDTLTFHHDFQKTAQGTYLLLANKPVWRKIINGNPTTFAAAQRDFIFIKNEMYAKTDVAVVIEFDKNGTVLWWWDADTYLKDEDLNFKKGPEGFPQLQSHANAIGISADNKTVYVGFRDLSRIIKIDKQTKQIVMSYGQKYPSGEATLANELFKQQHDAKPTGRNSLLLFNNNGPKGGFGISSILEINTATKSNDSLLKWSFTLDFDTLTRGRSGSGGNVNELPNGNILLCAGQLNRIFEVSKSKEIVWDAFIYAHYIAEGIWKPFPNYRASWIKSIDMPTIYASVIGKKVKKANLIELEVYVSNPNNVDASFSFSVEPGASIKKVTKGDADEAGRFQYKLQIESKNLTIHSLQISECGPIQNVKILNF